MHINVHTESSATHFYTIVTNYHHTDPDAYVVEFRPINPKTGQPWQAWRRIVHGADITPPMYRVPVAYSTFGLAQAAIAHQRAVFIKRNRRP